MAKQNAFLPSGIRLTKAGTFSVAVCKNGERVYKNFNNLEDAIEWKRYVKEYGIARTSLARSKFWTIEEAYNKADEIRWQSMSSQKTNEFYSRSIFRYFGRNTLLKDVTVLRIDDFVAHLRQKGDSSATIHNKLCTLSVMFKIAKERGGMGDFEVPKMPKQKKKESRTRFLSPSEEERLLKAMEMREHFNQADAVRVLLYTGFRCGELWKLQVRDVDVVHGIITTWETKNGHSRSIPLLDCIKDVLLKHCERKVPDDYVFEDGSNNWLRNAWDNAREDIGMTDDPQFVPHMLRHTCATRLSQQGVSLPVIKQWLGHTDINTTIRYAHFNQHDMFAASNLLNATSQLS